MKTMTCYSEREKRYVQMTLEQAVRDPSWGFPTWGISIEWFNEDKTITSIMKRCGYEPELNENGKFIPFRGMYCFEPIQNKAEKNAL